MYPWSTLHTGVNIILLEAIIWSTTDSSLSSLIAVSFQGHADACGTTAFLCSAWVRPHTTVTSKHASWKSTMMTWWCAFLIFFKSPYRLLSFSMSVRKVNKHHTYLTPLSSLTGNTHCLENRCLGVIWGIQLRDSIYMQLTSCKYMHN